MNKKTFENRQEDMLKNVRKTIRRAQDKEQYPKFFNIPVGVQYELTTKCNMKCIHCYNKSNSFDTKESEKNMSIEDWVKLTKDLIDNGGIFQCIISGGEPLLLGDDLLKIMDLLHKDNSVFTLITNGYLLDEEWINKLLKYRFNRFQISIDSSNAKEHNQFRQKEGSWQKAIEAAYLVSENNLPLVIASSVTPNNLNEMGEMADLAYRLGASSLIFGKIMLSGRAAENKSIILNQKEEEIFFKQVGQLRKKYANTMQIQFSSNIKNQLENLKSTPTDGVIIRPNGDVRLDCNLPFVIGNVLEDSFVNIWNKKARDCLQHPKVEKYIASLDSDEEEHVINYLDDDILI